METGTIVKFEDIKINEEEFLNTVIPFLIKEFCWFLELTKNNGYSLLINNKEIDY